MKRWAKLNGSTCTNVVEQVDMPTVGGEWVDVSGLPVGPGMRYEDGVWSSAYPGIPPSVTMRQARLALLSAGKLAAVESFITGLPEPQKTAAIIEWEYSNEVQRHNGFVAQLGPALGLSETDLDVLFVTAAGL